MIRGCCRVNTVNKLYNTQWRRYSDGAIWVLLSPASLARMKDFAEKTSQDKEVENFLRLLKNNKNNNDD